MASGTEVNSAVEGHIVPRLDVEDGDKETDEDDRDEPVEHKGSTSSRKDSTTTKAAVKKGHLRVGEDGTTMYKKTPSSAIMAAIQLGIGYSVGRLASKPERDVLMVDFSFVEKVWFPGSGSRETPSHKFSDFRFKSYAPVAFRYFRDLFGIQPSDFLMSLSHEEVREVGNPGASGSLFFLSKDDMFIVKTVQHKEAVFLQQLLPGYYMNLHQNPRTLLPKFFGLYCYQSGSTNIRLVVMNNLLPSRFKYHQKYDLKGSTFKRRASKTELSKKAPTRKDLDFLSDHPEGILLEAETYDAVMKTIMRDCRVLESFKIMDYSLLLGIHNLDQAVKDKALSSPYPSAEVLNDNPERLARRDEFSAALEAIQIEREEGRPVGGVPGKNSKGERLILFIGVIDILQSYRLGKKLEHGWKSFLHDGDTVSVHKPSFYAKRFLDFMGNKVFRRMPTVARGPSKRRAGPRSQGQQHGNTPYRGKASTTEVPGPRLGDEMIPPPYEEPQVEETPSSSSAAGGAKRNVEIATTTKTVKFSVEDSPSRENREEDRGKEVAASSEATASTPTENVTSDVFITSENMEATSSDIVTTSEHTEGTTSDVVTTSENTEVTTSDVITTSENTEVITTTTTKTVTVVETASAEASSSEPKLQESVALETRKEILKEAEAPSVAGTNEPTLRIEGNIPVENHEVTIIEEVHVIGPDGKEEITKTITKSGGNSEEVVVVEQTSAEVENDKLTNMVTKIITDSEEITGINNEGKDTEPETSTSQL